MCPKNIFTYSRHCLWLLNQLWKNAQNHDFLVNFDTRQVQTFENLEGISTWTILITHPLVNLSIAKFRKLPLKTRFFSSGRFEAEAKPISKQPTIQDSISPEVKFLHLSSLFEKWTIFDSPCEELWDKLVPAFQLENMKIVSTTVYLKVWTNLRPGAREEKMLSERLIRQDTNATTNGVHFRVLLKNVFLGFKKVTD